ncbi:ABC transporter ATP-binding protein [Tropicimonas isoalkanivorans]|uniref:Spermidine/putrescine import ATP-binding protein PotA n=1 Tax=Tropicimonas isoalkanivorans TaxID=441112 RepID=A0A1I1HTS5_9RHOB|nr:ABC transporter ATP-binding protein [Tropicimonas isoalkanivorans]SFC26982.1 putative spermidine/putrescine transport system ATP-binding protein [Tropicimonas isoalkanivorans]
MTATWPLQLDSVEKWYGGFQALRGIDLHVDPGEFLTILGPSGSGKTTALKCVAGFELPDRGRISLGREDITDAPPSARDIGMVFQNYALFPHMTVAQNVAFPLKMRRTPRAEVARRVSEVLEMTELGALAKRLPKQLSGGQQQRVALARAVVFQPRLLLLDEPFGALDRQLREQMQMEVRRLQQALHLTCVFITHDQEEALVMSDRIAVLFEGEIQQVGTPEEIYDRPANLRVAEFVGESNILEARVLANGDTFSEIEAGSLRLRLPHGGSVHDAGQSVSVLVRPERLRPGYGTEGPSLRARVSETAYLGSTNRVLLETEDGRSLIMRLPAGMVRPTPGEVMDVGFDPDTARILRRHIAKEVAA